MVITRLLSFSFDGTQTGSILFNLSVILRFLTLSIKLRGKKKALEYQDILTKFKYIREMSCQFDKMAEHYNSARNSCVFTDMINGQVLV